jgi:sugar phosphate isomerase/epimerase
MAGSMIAAQLYTVREFTKTPADIAKTLKKVRDMGYEAVQTSALTICATHVPYEKLRDQTDAMAEEHHIIGCKFPAIGGLPASYRNAEGFPRFAKEASEVGRKLKAHGLTFGYHNHSFELEKFGTRTGLQILYEDSDPTTFTSEIDTYWVQHGGGSPAAWVRRLKGRAPCLHLKDMTNRGGAQLMAEVGEGNLDWPDILAAAREAGTEWYIVEQDTCQRDPFESLAISLRNLKAMGLP